MLARACAAVKTCAETGGTVYLVGNGGSAAICDHLVCDLVKGTFHPEHKPVLAVSLTENVAIYTAVANDFGFEDAFSWQISARGRPNDVLIAVSSSGKSENIIRAVVAAKEKGLSTIGLSGFGGGRLKETADIPLHVAVDNYGVVEDAHQALLHAIVQMIGNERDGRS
ncbi:SIS domain-containing protein [Jiella endophytica]|uniref:SIS domain-containing protein n=2 Tax=Jiella endophytica TaxID=2558362 RepID=A0A4Y8RKR4_9HYPH|nr:SIS domain-containing protein [Jiella endophytica]